MPIAKFPSCPIQLTVTSRDKKSGSEKANVHVDVEQQEVPIESKIYLGSVARIMEEYFGEYCGNE